jgi:transcriptional regulator of arginine metabolism
MKIKRQSKLIEIVKNNDIETQDELALRLREEGFVATQATISRDIRDLKLIKVSSAYGKQKYALVEPSDAFFLEKLYKVFAESVIRIDYAQNLVVIKTMDGMAMAAAAALDGMDKAEVVGTIAGDDTIFCVLRTEEEAAPLISDLNDICYAYKS